MAACCCCTNASRPPWQGAGSGGWCRWGPGGRGTGSWGAAGGKEASGKAMSRRRAGLERMCTRRAVSNNLPSGTPGWASQLELRLHQLELRRHPPHVVGQGQVGVEEGLDGADVLPVTVEQVGHDLQTGGEERGGTGMGGWVVWGQAGQLCSEGDSSERTGAPSGTSTARSSPRRPPWCPPPKFRVKRIPPY